MDRNKKGERIGALGALLVHAAVIALLILMSFKVPQPDEDAGGVPVMMGNVDAAHGFDDPSLVDVDILPEEIATSVEPVPETPSEQDLLTQTEEETVALKPKIEPKKETVKLKKEVPKPKDPVKKPEKTAAEKAAEAEKLAEVKAERERKAAEEAARNKVLGAFSKGTQMGASKGTAASGTGVEGSKNGNSSIGAKDGVGGNGTYDLGGRSLADGNSLKLVCDVNEEGRVVVDITVAPSGAVIRTSINLRKTNTTNPILRKKAEDAVRKVRFNEVEGVNNQQGTITYNFRYSQK